MYSQFMTHGQKYIKLNIIKYKTCFWFSLQRMCEPFLILSKIQRDIINTRNSACKEPFFLLNFNQALIFSTDFRKKYPKIKFQENPSCSMRTDTWTNGKTDRHDEADFLSIFCEPVSNRDARDPPNFSFNPLRHNHFIHASSGEAFKGPHCFLLRSVTLLALGGSFPCQQWIHDCNICAVL